MMKMNWIRKEPDNGYQGENVRVMKMNWIRKEPDNGYQGENVRVMKMNWIRKEPDNGYQGENVRVMKMAYDNSREHCAMVTKESSGGQRLMLSHKEWS